MVRSIIETAFFSLWLIIGHSIILFGRYIFHAFIAVDVHEGRNVNPPGAVAVAAIIFAGIVYGTLRIGQLTLQWKMLIGLTTAALGSLLVQAASGSFSAVACSMHFYFFFTGLVVVGLHDCFHRSLRREFWNALFDHMTKMIQYFLALFIGGLAVLRYIYPEGRSGNFQADVFYCTVAFVFSLMLIAYWVMLPTWLRVIDSNTVRDGQ